MAVARYPFNKPTADLILRSSDRVLFRTHKTILAEASPFLARIIPHSAAAHGASVNDLPVLEIEAQSRTVENLLTICYPVPNPLLASSREISDVLHAAAKYDVSYAFVVCKQALLHPDLVRDDPLGVYAVACMHRLEGVARAAARHTLRFPYLLRPSEAMNALPAPERSWLLWYRDGCRQVAIRTVHFWYSSRIERAKNLTFECEECRDLDIPPEENLIGFSVDKEYFLAHTLALMDKTPCGEVILNDAELGSWSFVDTQEISCCGCREGIALAMRRFRADLAREVDRAIFPQSHSLVFPSLYPRSLSGRRRYRY